MAVGNQQSEGSRAQLAPTVESQSGVGRAFADVLIATVPMLLLSQTGCS